MKRETIRRTDTTLLFSFGRPPFFPLLPLYFPDGDRPAFCCGHTGSVRACVGCGHTLVAREPPMRGRQQRRRSCCSIDARIPTNTSHLLPHPLCLTALVVRRGRRCAPPRPRVSVFWGEELRQKRTPKTVPWCCVLLRVPRVLVSTQSYSSRVGIVGAITELWLQNLSPKLTATPSSPTSHHPRHPQPQLCQAAGGLPIPRDRAPPPRPPGGEAGRKNHFSGHWRHDGADSAHDCGRHGPGGGGAGHAGGLLWVSVCVCVCVCVDGREGGKGLVVGLDDTHQALTPLSPPHQTATALNKAAPSCAKPCATVCTRTRGAVLQRSSSLMAPNVTSAACR